MRRVLLVALLALVAAGCRPAADPRLLPAATAGPPSPATWPAYPAFDRHSCWIMPVAGPPTPPQRYAPSYDVRRPAGPQTIARRVLAGLGDRRYIRAIRIGAPPPAWAAHNRPPRDAAWAYLTAPQAHSTGAPGRAGMLADWEANLVFGALRDGFCAAGRAPLAGFSIGGDRAGLSQAAAFGQRFPNPTPVAFRARVAAIGRRFGFRTVSLRLLRPAGIVPLLVVRTDRPRGKFVRDVGAIEALLDPQRNGRRDTASTFEGIFFEARDAGGPFVRTSAVLRGTSEQGQWAWDRCWYPFAWPRPPVRGRTHCPPGSTG